MKVTRTLRFHLTLLFSTTLAILCVIILSFLLHRVESRMLDEIDGQLLERVEGLVELVDSRRDHHEREKRVKFLENRVFENVINDSLQDEVYLLFDEERHILFVKTLSDDLISLKVEDFSSYDFGGFAILKFFHLNFSGRAYSQEVFDGMSLVLVESLASHNQQIGNIRFYFISAALLLVFIGGFIAWVTVGRSMQGVLQVSKAADDFGQGDLKRRVHCQGKGNEIEHLSDSFNQMAQQTETLIFEMKDVTNSIAHDLRTPVTRMRGVAENALQNKETIDLAAKIIEECEHQTAIIGDILNLAESESGVLELHLQEENLSELLTDMTELFQASAEEKECRIVLSLPDEPVRLMLDRSRTQRAVSNIIDNALKYSGAEQVDISLIQEGQEVQIFISDDGCGIPSELRRELFKRFVRGDESRSLPGSGLGLSLARAYMQNHGGSIILHPSASGASFLISLPNN